MQGNVSIRYNKFKDTWIQNSTRRDSRKALTHPPHFSVTHTETLKNNKTEINLTELMKGKISQFTGCMKTKWSNYWLEN
jgi:hypothetical protein